MSIIPPQLIGESPEFHAMLDWVSDIASVNLPVLVLGETGTGKEIIASRLHFLSPRWEQSHHSINCAAYDEDILTGIIYGDDAQTGLLEQAEGGTLFLGNIEGLSPAALERLAQMVEYGSFLPLDGRESLTIDIRFVFSADPAIIAGAPDRQAFTTYLDRLAKDVVNIAPLRDRRSDIVPLLLHFGRKTASKLGAEQFPGLTPEAMEALLSYDWPGNVRELNSVIERSTARAFLKDETLATPITDIHFSPFIKAFRQKPAETSPLPEYISETKDSPKTVSAPPRKDFESRVFTFERGLIDEAMTTHNHHQGKAADYLGLSYHQFRGLLRKHGLKK